MLSCYLKSEKTSDAGLFFPLFPTEPCISAQVDITILNMRIGYYWEMCPILLPLFVEKCLTVVFLERSYDRMRCTPNANKSVLASLGSNELINNISVEECGRFWGLGSRKKIFRGGDF